jgi:hypothetical protein
MVEELCSIKANKMWEVTNLPTSYHRLASSGSTRARRMHTGTLSSTRLGLSQRDMCKNRELISMKFTLVARMESVRLILAVAMHEGWHVHHVDAKFTFLNNDLMEEVYA